VSLTWRRLGRLALDTSRAPWAATHAALPALEALDDGRWAVYLSLRDREGRARIGRTVLDMRGTPALAPLDADPVLDLGTLGTFDDSGVTMSCLVTDGDARYLYYTGWCRGVTVPFYLNAGVAVSRQGGPFVRPSPAPLLDRSPADPFLTASPFVTIEDGRWRMWYVSATEWRQTPTGPRHYYNVRYAESPDGTDWTRDGRVCLDYRDGEYAFARPWVVRDADGYRMWFAVRGDHYRIELADSTDGLTWSRQATGGLAPASTGWDAEMVEYPCVFDWRGNRYLLYNGNDYGRTGVGLAVCDR
jgi:hypothetical protein